jgi:hypothetical protein
MRPIFKRAAGGIAAFGLVVAIAASGNSDRANVQNQTAASNSAPVQFVPTAAVSAASTSVSLQPSKKAAQQASPQLSNQKFYVNSSGNTVHSPAYASDNAIPSGASAKCRDGTYSFSEHRRGTCSRHGGVAQWL